MGIEPIPSGSQPDVQNRYTTDTILFVSGRRGNRTLKAVKLDRLPTGSRRQSGSPSVRSVFCQQPDQDSNPEFLVRSQT